MNRIIAICLVKNEDIYIQQVILNIIDFCDEIIVADNMSDDSTYERVSELCHQYTKIKLLKIEDYTKSQDLIKDYANTPTWIFGVDGDEVYDPDGLKKFRDEIVRGDYDEYTHIYGNVLNCVEINQEQMMAKGFLSPPSRSMTKIYNYSIVKDASDRGIERLHGKVILKDDYKNSKSLSMQNDLSWEESRFRFVHLCFMKRSSRDKGKSFFLEKGRQNISDQGQIGLRVALKKLSIKGLKEAVLSKLGISSGSQWKMEKYKRGELVTKDVSIFFRKSN